MPADLEGNPCNGNKPSTSKLRTPNPHEFTPKRIGTLAAYAGEAFMSAVGDASCNSARYIDR